MPIIEVLRNLLVMVLGGYLLVEYGTPIVDRHFGLTIGYVADSFLAIAPLPPPSTILGSQQPPVPIAPTPVVLKTIFVEQALQGTDSSRVRATITAINYGTGSRSHDDPSSLVHLVSAIFDWCAQLMCAVPRCIIWYLRQLLDNWVFQVSILIAPIVSWQLSKIRGQMLLERIMAVHESETAAAGNLLITALEARITAQGSRLTEVEAQISAKTLAEVQFKSEIAGLRSELSDRDNETAGLRKKLAEANSRADAAELSNKTIEKRVKAAARSDHDSALQKKENEVNTHKNAREKAVEERDTARSELKAARAEASLDKKRIAELQKQATQSATNATESRTQLNQKNAIIGERDGMIRRLREEAIRASKEAHSQNHGQRASNSAHTCQQAPRGRGGKGVRARERLQGKGRKDRGLQGLGLLPRTPHRQLRSSS